jgi:protein-tyrosine phosphatase
MVKRAGLATDIAIDSAGTHDYHVGAPPDPRTVKAAGTRGYDLTDLRARLVTRDDFARFDWILGMDRANLAFLEKLRPASFRGHLGLFLDVVPGASLHEVPDPYCGGPADFARVVDLAEEGSTALLASLRA